MFFRLFSLCFPSFLASFLSLSLSFFLSFLSSFFLSFFRSFPPFFLFFFLLSPPSSFLSFFLGTAVDSSLWNVVQPDHNRPRELDCPPSGLSCLFFFFFFFFFWTQLSLNVFAWCWVPPLCRARLLPRKHFTRHKTLQNIAVTILTAGL